MVQVDGVSSDDINEPQPSKRSWKQLHGGWGKRSEELFQAGDNLKDVLKEVTTTQEQQQRQQQRRQLLARGWRILSFLCWNVPVMRRSCSSRYVLKKLTGNNWMAVDERFGIRDASGARRRYQTQLEPTARLVGQARRRRRHRRRHRRRRRRRRPDRPGPGTTPLRRPV